MRAEAGGPPLAVLLMAYGGPARLEDVEPYLLDVRGGRPMRPAAVAEIRERYRRIGGRSPILELTRAQAAALERRLNAGDGAAAVRVHVGMRHWFPYVREAVARAAAEGARRGVAIALAPQYSAMSVGTYLRRLEEATAAEAPGLAWRTVESWCDHPLLAEAFAGKLRRALERIPAAEREGTVVVFTAHSLPERILAEGDPYPGEVRRTIEAVLGRLPPLRWRQAWQSQGQTGEPWIGPDAADVLRELAAEGARGVVLAPIGFLCDHVEILYDVDVMYREIARGLGLAFARTESLNDDPLLVEALAELVRRHAPAGSTPHPEPAR